VGAARGNPCGQLHPRSQLHACPACLSTLPTSVCQELRIAKFGTTLRLHDFCNVSRTRSPRCKRPHWQQFHFVYHGPRRAPPRLVPPLPPEPAAPPMKLLPVGVTVEETCRYRAHCRPVPAIAALAVSDRPPGWPFPRSWRSATTSATRWLARRTHVCSRIAVGVAVGISCACSTYACPSVICRFMRQRRRTRERHGNAHIRPRSCQRKATYRRL
jgi:hypothetical protein